MHVQASPTYVDVLIIGAGQAGLSAAYHLHTRGFTQPEGTYEHSGEISGDSSDHSSDNSPAASGATDGATGTASASDSDSASGSTRWTFTIVDANPGPGGAWQHRWDSLTMATVNNIYDLPGMPQAEVSPDARASSTLIDYFGAFERRFDLQVRRPVRAVRVDNLPTEGDRRLLRTTLDDGTTIDSAFLVNATGTWTRPYIPHIPGLESFRGRIIHTQNYREAEEFRGQKVAIVGGGISATGHLAEVSRVAETTWFTRRPPDFREEFNGHDAVALVEERVRQGLRPQSVVSVTGLGWSPMLKEARARGVMVRYPMFTQVDETGVIDADGHHRDFDAIIFGTGFRWEMRHLAPLRLRNSHGGVTMNPPQVADDPRIFLVGYGPSASTVGANRAGRDAAVSIRRQLRQRA